MYLKVNNLGEQDLRECIRTLDEDTLIVTIMHANNIHFICLKILLTMLIFFHCIFHYRQMDSNSYS